MDKRISIGASIVLAVIILFQWLYFHEISSNITIFLFLLFLADVLRIYHRSHNR